MYQKRVGYSAVVSPYPNSGTKAISFSLAGIHCSPRDAPLSRLTGTGVPGPEGGVKFHWFGSWLLSELGVIGADTCAETLTASLSVKATARIIARKVKRDERLSRAMTKYFPRKTGSFYKDGRTKVQ
jgi:hypothetical protein